MSVRVFRAVVAGLAAVAVLSVDVVASSQAHAQIDAGAGEADVSLTEVLVGPVELPSIEERRRAGEVVEQRSLRSRTFELEGGGFETEVFAGAIHMPDDGGMVPLEQELTSSEAGFEGTPGVGLAVGRAGGDAVTVGGVSWRLRGASRGARGRPTADGALEFGEVLPGVDRRVAAFPAGVADDLVFSSLASVPKRLAWQLTSDHRLVATDSGVVEVLDASDGGDADEPVALVTPPFMTDADGNDVALSWTVRRRQLVLRTPTSWLRDPERAWPVTLDPDTLVLDNPLGSGGVGNEIDDTYISQANPDAMYPLWGKLRVGGGADVRRSLVWFDVAGAFAEPVQVRSAQLQLTSVNQPSSSQPIEVHRLTESWSEQTATTWNERDDGVAWSTVGASFDAEVLDGFTVDGSDDEHTVEIADLVQGWADGTTPQDGLLVKHADEAAGGLVEFAASGSSVVEDRPMLRIRWEPLFGDRPDSTVETFAFGAGLSAAVDVASGNLRLDATDTAFGAVRINRHHNSRQRYPVADLGFGWSSFPSVATRLFVEDNGDRSLYGGPFGHARFARQDDGTFVQPRGFPWTMSVSGAVTTIAMADSGWTLTFDTGSGRLSAIDHGDATSATITPDASNETVDTIAWSDGSTSTHTYFGEPGTPVEQRLQQVETPGVSTLNYGYPSNNTWRLVTVAGSPDGATGYVYDTSTNRITRVLAADGAVLADIVYEGPDGRVQAITLDPDGDSTTTSFAYGWDPSADGTAGNTVGTTTVTAGPVERVYSYGRDGVVTHTDGTDAPFDPAALVAPADTALEDYPASDPEPVAPQAPDLTPVIGRHR